MTSLTSLAARYPTDKGGYGPNAHWYLPFYDGLLARCSGSARLLEIGVQTGASLALFAEALPDAALVGVDVDLDQNVHAEGARVTLVQGDAYDPVTVERLAALGPYDLIIDDGPHDEASQRAFFGLYLQLLTATGAAVVEDVPTAARADLIVASVPVGFSARTVDLTGLPGVTGRDDRLVVAVRA